MASTDVGIRISAIDATQGAFASVTKSLGLLDSQASLVGSTLKSTLAGLAGTLTVGAFVGLIKGATDAIDRLNDLADATGASIENLSALEGVARRTGTSLDVVGTSLVKFNAALSSAKPGSDTERAIKALGLSVADLKAQDPTQALQATAKALAGFADDANKARLVQELFGKSLREVAPLLKDLAESGKPLASVTRAQAEEAEKFNKQLFILQANAGDAARTLASALLPTLNKLFESFNNFNKTRTLAAAASDVLEFNKQLEALQKRQAGPFNFAGNLGQEIEKVTGQLAAAKAAFNALDEAGRRNTISNGRSAYSERQGIGERPSAPDLTAISAGQAAAAATLRGWRVL